MMAGTKRLLMTGMGGIARIDRVVAQLEVWLDGSFFPFPKMKVKVIQRQSGDFLAVPNVAIRNLTSREPDGISGLGNSVDEAVNDLLPRFVAGVRLHTPDTGLTQE